MWHHLSSAHFPESRGKAEQLQLSNSTNIASPGCLYTQRQVKVKSQPNTIVQLRILSILGIGLAIGYSKMTENNEGKEIYLLECTH